MNKEQIDAIHRRQLARLLDHLQQNGRLDDWMERTIKRSFGFAFGDIQKANEGLEPTAPEQITL